MCVSDFAPKREAALVALAKRLQWKAEHLDPSGEPDWERLPEKQKEFWVICVRSLLEDRANVLAALQ